MGISFFEDYNKLIFDTIESVDNALLVEAAELIREVKQSGKKVIIVGNGGSAAMASHVAVDLTKAAGCRAITFNETDLITCFANDFGYEDAFQKALEFYMDKGDAVVLISCSGKSPNILKAADYVRSRNDFLVTFTGFSADNPLANKGNLNFCVKSQAYNIIENMHQVWLLSVCDMIIGKAEYPASPK